jgi:lantibiotic biosynthesis protein
MMCFDHLSLPGAAPLRWTPALKPGELRSAAGDALCDIAQSIPLPGEGRSGVSVAGGEAGHAVFYAYLACSAFPGVKSDDHPARARNHMQVAVDGIAHLMGQPDLYGGFTGIGWAANHLHILGVLEDDELCVYIDEALVAWLTRESDVLSCELIRGLAGVGVYGIARRHTADGREILRLVVKALESSAVVHQGYRAWFSAPRNYRYPYPSSHLSGCYNLGVSHGVPGAINFLAQAAELGVAGAESLARDAGAWLLSQQRIYRNGSRFGHEFVSDPMENAAGSRVAWCYGDLGISAALISSMRRLKHSDWELQALDIARAVALRRTEDGDVRDAGLCHGAIGNAHIFNRLYAATGEHSFLDAMHFWLRVGLSMRRPGMGLAGFNAWQPPLVGEAERDPWQPVAGFLEGIGGIGLALLGFLAPIEPAWDQLLMVDIPAKVA